LRKRDLSRCVNGDLAIQFSDERLTSFAGLEILMRHLRQLDLNGRLRDAFRFVSFHGDYPWIAMVRLVVALIVGGGDVRAEIPHVISYQGLLRETAAYTYRAEEAQHAVIADSAVVAGGGGAADSDWIITGDDMYAGITGRVADGMT
jgi:hypothetical protein